MADYDIGAAFAAIEDELMSSMVRNLQRHRAEETAEGIQWPQWQAQQLEALEEYRRKNQSRFKSRFSSINRKLKEAIRTAYTDGNTAQEKEILEAVAQGFSIRNQTDSLGAGFFTTNRRKLNALVKATTKDMQRAETAILRRANDQYRKIIFNAQVYANTGAGTYEKAVDMATKDFLAAGIDCVVYSNGARHTLSDYADMALRTASKRAYLQGEGAKRQEWGVTTVILNKRSNACPKCAQFCGKVFIDDVWSGGTAQDGPYPLLSSAVEQGLYHPRCKDSHTTYFPELSEEPEEWSQTELKGMEQREAAEQRQQYAGRQAEKYHRLEQYSLDGENRRKYGARAQEWEEQADITQNYPKVVLGEAATFSDIRFKDLKAKRVTTYSTPVYVSDDAKIKPRALHQINLNTQTALKKYGIPEDRRPTIVIVSDRELPTAWGRYDAPSNAVYYVPGIAHKSFPEPPGSTEYHEMWHAKQADDFRKAGWTITEQNYGEYITALCRKEKKNVDRAGITEYNVSEISRYAREMFDIARYDEVWAEYISKKLLGGVKHED